MVVAFQPKKGMYTGITAQGTTAALNAAGYQNTILTYVAVGDDRIMPSGGSAVYVDPAPTGFRRQKMTPNYYFGDRYVT